VDAAGLLGALEASALAREMRGSLWLYPIVEIGHIAGIAALVGSVSAMDLRLLGFARSLPALALGRFLLRWAWLGLALVIPTGLAMFSTHATEFAANPAFRLKLLLLAVAALNAATFHVTVYRTAVDWNRDAPTPPAAKVAGLISLVLWLGVIACGRMIAYV
jgi:hypothetical protein